MEIIAGAALAVLAQVVKKYLVPMGDWAVHAAIFAVAIVGVGVWQVAQSNPQVMGMLLQAVELLTVAIGVYEVILKRLGVTRSAQLLSGE